MIGRFAPYLEDLSARVDCFFEIVNYYIGRDCAVRQIFVRKKAVNKGFCLYFADGEHDNNLWVVKARFLVRKKMNGKKEDAENYGFAQYMEFTPPEDEVNEILACIHLQ